MSKSKKSKKSEAPILDHLYSADLLTVDKEVSNFYDDIDGAINIPEQEKSVSKIVEGIQKAPDNQTLTAEKMQERCLKIREYVKAGKLNNVMIDFVHGIQKHEGLTFSLGNTVLKAVEYISREPIYLYRREDDVIDYLAFIGGDYSEAFLVAKDDEGNTTFVKLAELHLLSINKGSTPKKQTGLMVSYNCYTATIYSSYICSFDLSPVINLLLAEEIYARAVENKLRLEEEDVDGQEETADEQTDYS